MKRKIRVITPGHKDYYISTAGYYRDLEENGSFCSPESADSDASAAWLYTIWDKYEDRIEPDPNMDGCYRIER
jgi:hypothetical protein